MTNLAKSSAIYTFGSLLRQVVSFLMLPIYTRHLSPSDYGVVEMLSVISSVLALIAGTHIGLATIRFFHAAPNEDEQKTVLSTATFTILLASCLVYLLFLLVLQTPAGAWITGATLGDSKFTTLLLLFSLTIIFQPIEEQMFTLLRLKDRPWAFIWLSTVKLAMQLGLNILFVVVLELKVAGVVYGSVITGGTFAVVSFLYTRLYGGWRFSPAISRKIIVFIFPLMIGAFGALYMSVSDRYLLQSLHDSASVGLYALGARFADILMVIGWWPFINVWQTHRFEIAKAPDAAQQFRNVFCAVTVYLIWLSLGIATLTDDVLRLLATEGFWPAADVTPPLLIASLLAAAIGFCNFAFMIKDRTGFIAKSTWVSAVALTASYAALVPEFGSIGAAWARVAAAAVQLAITVYWAQKIYPVDLPWRNACLLLLLATGLYLMAQASTSLGNLTLLVEVPLLALFPIVVLYAPLLPRDSRTWLHEQIKTSLASLRKTALRS
jgi:O-antigen/teichoic acid export membrane protein